MEDHSGYLFRLIDRVLGHDVTFDEFSRSFYDYYTETLPEDALTDEERAFLSKAQEKLDWTMADPDKESRKYGWVTPQEYLEWLRTARASYAEAPGP